LLLFFSSGSCIFLFLGIEVKLRIPFFIDSS